MPVGKWKLRLISPSKAIKTRLNKAGNLALFDLAKWAKTDFARALVHGGFGIQGIADTAFYRFISSPEGLSQLGIPATEPPRLLQAYEKTIKAKRSNGIFSLAFGNVAALKMATPHPAAGTGNLHIQSWLEWIVDNKTVDSGFVARNELPKQTQKRIRLGSPLGGLMLPQGIMGSSGLWRFPDQLRSYEQNWLRSNVKRIETVLLEKMIEFLAIRANG